MKSNQLLIGLSLLITGCTGAQVNQAADSLANIKYVTRRVSGVSYFKFDRKDSQDGYSAANGYLCINHNPGCGIKGNDGIDKFFNTPLPPLCTIIECDYVPFWPTDVSSDFAHTGNFSQSYGTDFTAGTVTTTEPYTVHWYNACWGPFAGKNLSYRISFLVKMPEHLSFGEDTFSQAPVAHVCIPAGFAEGKITGTPTDNTSPSGFSGQLLYCNLSNQIAFGKLQLQAKVVTPNSGAMGQDTMILNMNVQFDPSGGGQPSKSSFSSARKYKQGTWQITQARILGLTNGLTGLPKTVLLPGPPTTPILDFSAAGGCSH